MNDHLCLKWNNHSSSFIKSFKNIRHNEKYCDATIVCQGKYFPVHRVVLATCSDYFEEIYDRIKCPHPYIIFKDIEPRDFELLLSYMYEGEVNVLQEGLPTLIKAAESLRIKGLAVPDDISPNKEERVKKRSSDSSQFKRKTEEINKRKDNPSCTSVSQSDESEASKADYAKFPYKRAKRSPSHQFHDEPLNMKEEPLDSQEYNSKIQEEYGSTFADEGTEFEKYSSENSLGYIKSEPSTTTDPLEEQPYEFGDTNTAQNFEDSEIVGPSESNICKLSEHSMESDIHDGCHDKDQNFHTIDEECSPRRFLQFGRFSDRMNHCPYCNYGSRNSGNLKRHIMHKHTGERPFACTLCSSRFTEKISLDRHLRTHSGEKPYHCSHCGKKFTTKGSVKGHVQKFHST